ncbi:MAG TPA: hypothetical protein VKZ63_15265 [Kofleriaceae bacterium]|nr:hypothetical protein [Kofleriaceae bacterium]
MMRAVFVAGAVAVLSAACGGADVPEHNGYKSPTSRPWQSPVDLVLDEDNEAEVDDVVSYPKRQRARWYAVDLPSAGELEVKLSIPALLEDREVDLAFEILDEGYQVIAAADRDADDAGEEEKIRLLGGLQPGRYYVHVYAQHRLDEIDFTLQVAFRPDAAAVESNFPASVAFIGALPDVPAVDDAPAPQPKVVKKCRGARCRKRPPPPDPTPQPRAVRARVAGIVKVTAGGTQIRIDRGTSQGVEVGWKGSVVTRDGNAIPGGSFEISRVTAAESFATVQAAASAVTSAKYVRLRPP